MSIRKIIIPALVAVIFAFPVVAANSGDNGDQGSGQGLQAQVQQEVQNQGDQQQLQTSEQSQFSEEVMGAGENGNSLFELKEIRKGQTINEVKEIVQEKNQEMIQEMAQMGELQQKVYQNQNQVRKAVHALLAAEDLVEGIGPQVSQIAREFNNSVQATVKAEEKIQQRNAFTRFFLGGENEAAEEVLQEVERNKERIQELSQLKESCECDQEVKAMVEEQIQKMEQEQERLQQLADGETKAKGILGWIRNLFRR